MERRQFEMSQADLDGIVAKIKAARETPLIATHCGMPPSIQQVANEAWAELGGRLGFDPMTVQPTGRGDRFFTALASPPLSPPTSEGSRPDGEGSR